MSTLQEALARVARAVRPQHHGRRPPVPPVVVPPPPVVLAVPHTAPPHAYLEARPRMPRRQLAAARPHLQGFLRKRFQRFLEPLGMPQLKIYAPRAPYDERRAEHNLALKRSGDRRHALARCIGERPQFDKMMRLLVELTPAELMDRATAERLALLAHVLAREEQRFHEARPAGVPRFHFGEVPPVPVPLARDSFLAYVHWLTHCKHLYRNLSLLTSGVVAEILLYTHRVDNAAFRAVRSAETYNCLIKYFGYDKRQSAFARELVLAMVRDGHAPNTNTINQLLKLCRVHRARRSLVSTYKVAGNYLRLAKRLGLRADLATWNRVYDCIDNIFLKEAFLHKMLAVCLPVLDNMCLRVLADFCDTTASTDDVVRFVELDLRRPAWRLDPRLAEKVLYHHITHLRANELLASVFVDFWPSIAHDALSLKTVANAIEANPNFSHKGFLLLCTYVRLSPAMLLVPPEVYSRVARELCKNSEHYPLESVCFLVRAIVHHDATNMLGLPVETVEYGPQQDAQQKVPATAAAVKNPYWRKMRVPKAVFSENYKIFKRLSQNCLNVLEAKVIYARNENPDLALKYPWEPLSDLERTAWAALIEKIRNQHDFWEHSAEKAARIGLAVSREPMAPAKWIAAYELENYVQMRLSNEIDTVRKLEMGLERHTEYEMKKRNIYTVPEHPA